MYDGSGDEVANLATYGRLYNWYAVKDSRGLCPTGYHVSNDEDWNILESHLGGSSLAGHAMKSAAPGWDGTNSSGFTALPGGWRYLHTGSFNYQGGSGYWWSSSPNGLHAWRRHINSGVPDFFRVDFDDKRFGFSVRCIQDCQDADGDGICNYEEVVGCQIPGACNYSALATDAGACLIPAGCDTCDQGNLVDNDSDDDGVCDANEVLGCTDSAATNYSATATEEDGSCTYGPVQCGGATSVTFNGHTYAVVAIGTQCWFAENLRSENYRNGDAIPGNLSDAQWTSTSLGAQTVYGEGTSPVYAGSSDEGANLATYGRLYNWYAVNDSRGICPLGFHVPSDGEWTVLENTLGGSSVAGTTLKATSPFWDGTNSSGFSALPGGYRNADGHFINQSNLGDWWTSSSVGQNAWYRNLLSGNSILDRNYNSPRDGFSIRCVRD